MFTPMKTVAFLDFVFEDKADLTLPGCKFKIYPPLENAAQIIQAAHQAHILTLRDFNPLTAEIMDACPNLDLIATRTTGTDHIDLAAAQARNITVCHVPDYGAHMIAEHAFGLMLAVARHTCTAYRRYRQDKQFNQAGLCGVELHGKTLGIVGTGRIGHHSLHIGQGFGMNLVAFDVAPDQTLAAKMGFAYLPLPDLLAQADFITLHVPLSESTHHLINADTLAHLKPGAILVNTSRGGVVDTAALKKALAAGQLRGAGLDVLEDELDTYHDFGQANVIITPHIAWYTAEACHRLVQISLNNIRAWLAGEPINRVA